MVLCGVWCEEILTALGHLPEYPTCSKAVCWYGIRCTMNFAGPAKPSLQYGSTPSSGILLLCNRVGCLMGVHPFNSYWVFSQSRIIPEFCFGFLGTFHRTVLLYYGRQVSEACYVTATYGVKDSLVRAIIAEKLDSVFLATVLDLVHYKEESGPIMMYCFLGLLPNVGKIVYI